MSKLSSGEIERLKNSLKEKGYKLTPQRRAIVDIIIKNEGKHLTTEEIYDLVKKDCPEIGLATVYRTVQLLEDIGVVCKLDLDDGCSRYEIIHEQEIHQHHHLICTRCSRIIEVPDKLLEGLESQIESKYNFKILNHSLKFYGICSECLEKSKKV
ncbi:Fur family ferric uptake transcriptional regulator [Clostridium algifaecis]|uniref:Fur family ferric uptake transcriptional regulator n=1 Tax=Clostridium algifaecis TaxID=1472040 RepID=A0ABS4KQB3_9CLOT|nr:Fur family transcriptional regulator [Clostridium algifaecis]MBP2031566.1 Fur family ferric uptake transcriptional regulator [Clostridium algifaecis]